MLPDPNYNIQDYSFSLAVARAEVEVRTGLCFGFVVQKYDDINSGMTVRFGRSSAPAKVIREGLRLYFDEPYEKIFISNAVGVGTVEFCASLNVNVYMPPRVIGDMTNTQILEQQVAVGAGATPIPAVALAGRKKIMVVNVGANPVELGSATVTFGTGIPLAVNNIYSDTITENVILYGIVAVGNENVRVLEGA